MMVKKYLSIVMLIGIAFAMPAKLQAQNTLYLDPADKLIVHSPAPFSTMSSPLRIELEVLDDEQSTVTYNLVVYGENRCIGETTASQIGQIAANVGLQSINIPIPSSLESGCLEICVGLQADQTLYPVCNQRILGEGNVETGTTSSASSLPARGEFSLPALGSILNGEFNRVQWSFKQAPTAEISLSYHLVGAGQPAKLIAKLPPEAKSFIWDVSGIVNGQYYLEIATQVAGTSEIFRSPVFLIDNPGRATETAKPLIVISSPLANTVVNDQRPLISGSFVAASGDRPQPESFTLEINGEDRTSICQVNTSGFNCQGGPSLLAGLQKIRASYRTTSQQTGVAEWSFSVNPIPGTRTNFGGINLADVNWLLVGIIMILVFLVIFLPWFVWTRWRQRTIVKESYINEDYEPQVKETHIVKEKETQTNIVPVTQNTTTTVVSDAGYIDPAAYTSYEDYLKAVSQKLAESEKTYVVSSPQSDKEIIEAEVSEQNMISVPDYESGYRTSNNSSSEKSEEKKDSSESKDGDNTPEWLRS